MLSANLTFIPIFLSPQESFSLEQMQQNLKSYQWFDAITMHEHLFDLVMLRLSDFMHNMIINLNFRITVGQSTILL